MSFSTKLVELGVDYLSKTTVGERALLVGERLLSDAAHALGCEKKLQSTFVEVSDYTKSLTPFDEEFLSSYASHEYRGHWEAFRDANPATYKRHLNAYLRTQGYDAARNGPAIKDSVDGCGLNVLEICGRADVSVPQTLGHRIGTYLNVDIDENPVLSKAWAEGMRKAGQPTTNKFRVAGFSTNLPVGDNTQDLVYASYANPFVFSNTLPLYQKEQSVAEAFRVLKPGGKLIIRPFDDRVEEAGAPIINRHFRDWFVHSPSAIDQAKLKSISSSSYEPDLKRGALKSLVATKHADN